MPVRALKHSSRALQVWPDRRRWVAAAGLALPATAIIALAGYLGGWLRFEPVAISGVAHLVGLILLFVAVLAEELVFRGLLLSAFAAFSQRLGNWLSIGLFVLWQPVQALVFSPPWSAILLQPSFLFATFILGIVVTHIRIVSQSLWPAILIRWLLLVVWTLLLGGPFCGKG